MKKIASRVIGILFAFLLLAGMFVISCDRPATQTTDPGSIEPEKRDTPSNKFVLQDTNVLFQVNRN